MIFKINVKNRRIDTIRMCKRESGSSRVSSRRDNKRFGYRYVTYITIQDATKRSPKLVYRTLELIVKRYDGRHYGVHVKTDRSSHIHAILVSRKYVDLYEVKHKIRPCGVNVDVRHLNRKTIHDLRRIVRYIESKKNTGRKLGSRYVIRIAQRIISESR